MFSVIYENNSIAINLIISQAHQGEHCQRRDSLWMKVGRPRKAWKALLPSSTARPSGRGPGR